MTKIRSRQELIKQVKSDGIHINIISSHGNSAWYNICRLDKVKMPDDLREQLEHEGKSMYYCSYISSDKYCTPNADKLPIFGNSDKYITKWFYETPVDVLKQDLRDRDYILSWTLRDIAKGGNSKLIVKDE